MKIIIPLRLARGYHVIRKLGKDFLIWGGKLRKDVGGRVMVRREVRLDEERRTARRRAF